jgi:hypothetical protein
MVEVTQGDHGTYEDAVRFALDVHDDRLGTYQFLKAWNEGDLLYYPEYYEWLSTRKKTSAQPAPDQVERAREIVAERLRSIGKQDARNGFTKIADDLMNGDLMQLPTWVALDIIADLLGKDLVERAALREAIEDIVSKRLCSFSDTNQDRAEMVDAILAALQPPARIDGEEIADILARLPQSPWLVVGSIYDGFEASLEVDNEGNFGNIAHFRKFEAATAIADLIRTLAAALAESGKGCAE